MSCLPPSWASSPTDDDWIFVSSPDFVNIDVGDLTRLEGYRGERNSSSAKLEQTIERFLSALAAENPDFVAVAGDLVMARWHQDAVYKGVFGPEKTDLESLVLEEEIERVRRAARFYYEEYVRRLDRHGLVLFAAVGDHELGDDFSWGNLVARQTVPAYREAFAWHFVEPLRSRIWSLPGSGEHSKTAYAIKHRNLLFISVDVFKQLAPTDRPEVTVDGEQLTWLAAVLGAASADRAIRHIVVQGHVPVLYKNQNLRGRVAGRLHLSGDKESEFWKTLRAGKVDLYLAGEFHAVNVNQDGPLPPLQVVHGGLLGFPASQSISYMVVTVHPNRLQLTMKEIKVKCSGEQLFQPGNPMTRAQEDVSLEGDWRITGTLEIDKTRDPVRYLGGTGVFRKCVPSP